ncbi:MAG: ShlB/FhaC/HecB family hemolysin secretion/activation protein [Moraxellaceae bacterium]|nr:ShlB/FhaC/HecB family hemolysin secretion/activation protein [Moraxellaceae bacterium]
MFTRMCCLTGMMLVAVVLPARANEADRLLKQEIDRREQERRERRWDESHSPGGTLSVPEATKPATPAGPCFPVQHIDISPSTVLPTTETTALIKNWAGRCLFASDLAALQEGLNAIAMRQGLITTRAVVPEQNLASGRLRLELWPGVVEGVRAPSLSYMEYQFALPLKRGDPVQLRALEQAVDNLNRLSSVQASIELFPGETPGGSVIDITAARNRPWQARADWQGVALNREPTQTLRGSVSLDSPLRLVDRLTLGVNANLQDGQVDDANGASLDYDLPFGWWRFGFGTDRFAYENALTAGITHFQATGKSRAWRSELSRALHRNVRQRLSLAVHTHQRISENLIEGTVVGVSSYRVRATGLRIDHAYIAAPWLFDTRIDAEYGQTRSAAPVNPFDASYWRYIGNSRVQYRHGRASLSAALSAQASDARLPPGEQFSLTGQTGGYDPVAVSADTAVGLRMEAGWTWPARIAGFHDVRSTIGVNWAMNPERPDGERTELSTATTGLVLSWPRALLHLDVAIPLKKLEPEPAPAAQLNAGVNLQW